jgi:hypothetical protein
MTRTIGITALMNTAEWNLLSAPQAAFVAKYIGSGRQTGSYDAVDAARIVYHTKNVNSARAFSYELLGSKRIRAVLDLWFGRTPLDGLVIDLRRHIKRSEKALKAVEQHLAGKV